MFFVHPHASLPILCFHLCTQTALLISCSTAAIAFLTQFHDHAFFTFFNLVLNFSAIVLWGFQLPCFAPPPTRRTRAHRWFTQVICRIRSSKQRGNSSQKNKCWIGLYKPVLRLHTVTRSECYTETSKVKIYSYPTKALSRFAVLRFLCSNGMCVLFHFVCFFRWLVKPNLMRGCMSEQ